MRAGTKCSENEPPKQEEDLANPSDMGHSVADVQVAVLLPRQSPAMLGLFAWILAGPEAEGAWEGAPPTPGWGWEVVTDRLSGADFWMGAWADQTAAEIPVGGLALVMDALSLS